MNITNICCLYMVYTFNGVNKVTKTGSNINTKGLRTDLTLISLKELDSHLSLTRSKYLTTI